MKLWPFGQEHNKKPKTLNEEMFEAIAENNVIRLKNLLSNGADPNSIGRLSPLKAANTALHAAVQGGARPIIDALVEAGADINAMGPDGSTALHIAAYSSRLDIVGLLIQRGARVDVQDKDGWTPLHFAALQESRPVIDAVLAAGADVRAVNEEGRTALHSAAYSSCPDIVGLLIQRGASVDARTKDGQTPLHKIAWGNGAHKQEQKLATYEVLLKNGVRLSDHDKRGMTPLHSEAVLCGTPDVLRFLIRSGMDVDAHPAGFSALYSVVDHWPLKGGTDEQRRRFIDVATFLLKSGADPHSRFDTNLSPLEYARASGIDELVDVMTGQSEKKNLVRWRQSGQPRIWVEKHNADWNHNDWLELLNDLKKGPFWPMNPNEIGMILQELKTARGRVKADQKQCSQCSRAQFLEEWDGNLASCETCGREQVAQKPDRTWYSTVVGGEGLKRADEHARDTARAVIKQISREAVPWVWIVNFTSSQAVMTFASTIAGARMVGVLPRNTVVLKLVAPSRTDWEDCKRGAMHALQNFTGKPGTPSVVAAATDSDRDFRTAVERLGNARHRVRPHGYDE